MRSFPDVRCLTSDFGAMNAEVLLRNSCAPGIDHDPWAMIVA
jgi:hypothetical protein